MQNYHKYVYNLYETRDIYSNKGIGLGSHQVEHRGPQTYRSKSRTVGEKKFSAAVVRPPITLRFVAPYSVEHAISPPNRGLLISSTSARPYCI